MEKNYKDVERKIRLDYALEKLKKFYPRVCNESIAHIKIGDWSFWARTGKIFHPFKKIPQGRDRGITNFINLLKSDKTII